METRNSRQARADERVERRLPLEGRVQEHVAREGEGGEPRREQVHLPGEMGHAGEREDAGEDARGARGDAARGQRRAVRPPHACIHVAFAQLVEGVGPGRNERGAEQGMGEQPQVHGAADAEVEPGGRCEQHQLRDAGLRELEERYQTCSDMAARTKIAASGKGTIARIKSFRGSNLRCMKYSATSRAFQTAKNTSAGMMICFGRCDMNATPISIAVRTARYTQMST